MTASASSALRAAAQQIRNEHADNANTAIRVGDCLTSLIDSIKAVYNLSTLIATLSDTTTGAANTAILQAAAIAGSAQGGAEIILPAGDFYFQHGFLDVNVVCQLNGLSNLVFRGSGVGVTRLHLVNGADSSFFNLTGASSNIGIMDMELNGNRANQTPNIVHGIRGDAFSGLWLQNLYIHDISHYGIGIEGYVQQYMFFDNIKLENLGGDGFDQKNKADANLFQVASNITVTEFGLAGTTQAGWDCRGAWQLKNMVVHFTTCTTGSGIRFRNGETGTAAGGGFGGHRTHVSGLEVYGPGTGSSATGIEAVARDCVVDGAYIRDVLYGVSCSFDIPTGFGCSRSSFKGVTVENYGTAGFITSTGADSNDFENCTAIGSGVGLYGFRIRSSDNRLLSPRCLTNVTTDISIDTNGTFTQIESPKLVGTGSPGAAVTGIDVAGADCTLLGGDITGHVVNVSVSAARFSHIGGRVRSATTDNILVAVGGDDATFIGVRSRSAAAEGFQTRAARTTIIGGESVSNTGNGFQSEASASDCKVLDLYLASNGAEADDQGTNTTFRRSDVVAKSLNEAVASAGTSANIDVPLLGSTTYIFVVEATYEDSASARRTIRTKVQAYRSGTGAAVVSAGTNEFTTGAGTLTINLSGSGNNMRVSVTNGGANNGRVDTRIWEVWREKTVEFS